MSEHSEPGLAELGLAAPSATVCKDATSYCPQLADGFDNARTTFILPAAPSAPRAATVELDEGQGEGEDELAPTALSDVRQGTENDEIELLRTYAQQEVAIRWSIRFDPRAVAPLPRPKELTAAAQIAPHKTAAKSKLPAREVLWGAAGGI